LLGFEDDGRPLFSSRLTDADADKLGLHVVQRPPPRPLRDESRSYLGHHRANVFLA
jgi:putative restriction endonuclease